MLPFPMDFVFSCLDIFKPAAWVLKILQWVMDGVGYVSGGNRNGFTGV